MDEMEDKIGAILNNPQMMQQIMTMAQSLGGQSGAAEPPPKREEGEGFPQIDLAMVQKLSGLARRSGIDQREKALLQALRAYISSDRVHRLEKAMQAAKMAKIVTSVIGQQGLLGGGR